MPLASLPLGVGKLAAPSFPPVASVTLAASVRACVLSAAARPLVTLTSPAISTVLAASVLPPVVLSAALQ